jgi:predicted amidohydrolase
MRIALLQIRLDPKSRAANLQAVTRAIEAAAGAPDAPDLIVLPGGCDNGGAGASRGCSRSVLEVTRETLAWLAREWGVFLAAGVHAHRPGAWTPCAVLLDPDGDVVVSSIHRDEEDDGQAGDPIAPWPCPVADLAVLEPTVSAPLTECVSIRDRITLLALPVAGAVTARQRRVADTNISALRSGCLRTRNVYWAVVTECNKAVASVGEHGCFTFLQSPDGTILAAADGPEESIVHVDLPEVEAGS